MNPPAGIPPWVGKLGAPVWVVGSDRRIYYINEAARLLFRRPARRCLDEPCHLVVAGRDPSGRPYCGPDCPLADRAFRGNDVEPVLLRIRNDEGEDRWVQVLAIPVETSQGPSPWLVHCALSWDKAHRLEEYFSRVVARWNRLPARQQISTRALTLREREILQLLSEDESLHAIAGRLHLSYATVRNHVQHILAKLGVHSILEAVALHLLSRS